MSTSKRSKISIEVNAYGGFGTRVMIDGVEITGVRTIRFEHDVNDYPRVTLELLGDVTFPSPFEGVVDISDLSSNVRKRKAADVHGVKLGGLTAMDFTTHVDVPGGVVPRRPE